MAALVHGAVGLQHASMAIYNAWADRVPVLSWPAIRWTADAPAGRGMGPTRRRTTRRIVRDFTNGTTSRCRCSNFGESLTRAWRVAMTPPYAPTLITADGELAGTADHSEAQAMPKFVAADARRWGRSGTALRRRREAAGGGAVPGDRRRPHRAHPGRHGRSGGSWPKRWGAGDRQGRPDEFPDRHHLNCSGHAPALIRQADVILGLEVVDLCGVGQQLSRYRSVRDSHRCMQAQRQADQPEHARPADACEFPGLPALPAGRPGDHRRCRDDAALSWSRR